MNDIPPIKISVPATTGNLGPGFDVLGMALELRNEVVLRVVGRGTGRATISVLGEGAEELTEPASNRLVIVLRHGLEAADMGDLDLEVEQRNAIPLRRGLGSSAAAAVSGALACREILRQIGGLIPNDSDLVEEAIALALPSEGHPDNLVPALVGGLCLCWESERGVPSFLKLDPPEDLVAVLCIPEVEVATKDARAVLPEKVPLEDAVFSVGRAALLVAALAEGRYELLRDAARDRLHQPYRIGLLPAMGEAIEAALTAGAVSSWVSGSGSTVLALCREGDAPMIDAVSVAMAATFECGTHVTTARPARVGAVVTTDRLLEEGSR